MERGLDLEGRDRVSRKMTTEQVAEAQKLAREWRLVRSNERRGIASMPFRFRRTTIANRSGLVSTPGFGNIVVGAVVGAVLGFVLLWWFAWF